MKSFKCLRSSTDTVHIAVLLVSEMVVCRGNEVEGGEASSEAPMVLEAVVGRPA